VTAVGAGAALVICVLGLGLEVLVLVEVVVGLCVAEVVGLPVVVVPPCCVLAGPAAEDVTLGSPLL
jgi:hypothetical protein